MCKYICFSMILGSDFVLRDYPRAHLLESSVKPTRAGQLHRDGPGTQKLMLKKHRESERQSIARTRGPNPTQVYGTPAILERAAGTRSDWAHPYRIVVVEHLQGRIRKSIIQSTILTIVSRKSNSRRRDHGPSSGM